MREDANEPGLFIGGDPYEIDPKDWSPEAKQLWEKQLPALLALKEYVRG